MLFLTNEDVRRVLTMDRCLKAVEDCNREIANGKVIPQVGRTINHPLTNGHVGMAGTESSSSFYTLLLTSVLDLVYGVAVLRIDSFQTMVVEMHGMRQWLMGTGHYASEVPGFLFLFDLYKPRVIAMMQERDIQVMRVGATGGLGAKYMARKDAHTIGLLGAGWMGKAELAAHCLVRDIRLVKVFSPNSQHREVFAKQMSSDLGIEVRPVASAQEAIKGSDMVISATNSYTRTFDPEWLEPGMHVYCVHPHEYDERMVAKADLIAWGYPGQEELRTPERN